MKIVSAFILATSVLLSGCSTVSGAVRGVGEDVKTGTDRVADWIKPENKNR